MKGAAVLVLLSLVSLGQSAPLSNCEPLLKPIDISKEDVLGRWMFIAGTSNIPGTRSLVYLMNGIRTDVAATSQSNELYIVQDQKILGQCSRLSFNVTFENNMLLVEQPFHLQQIYLPTDCADCLVAKEVIVSGKDVYTSLIMFSRSMSVSPASIEKLKKQAQCLGMRQPMMLNLSNDPCPDNLTPVDGNIATKAFLDGKMGLGAASVLDVIFDTFVN